MRDHPAEADTAVPLNEAMRYWLRLGLISFGGPSGQIALMHDELVEKKRWISEQRFLHALNYCMLLPGPEAMQLATYIGWLMHRTSGAIIAGCLFVLPSLLLMITLSWAYLAFGDLPVVAGVLYGIKPAVVALVLALITLSDRRMLGQDQPESQDQTTSPGGKHRRLSSSKTVNPREGIEPAGRGGQEKHQN